MILFLKFFALVTSILLLTFIFLFVSHFAFLQKKRETPKNKKNECNDESYQLTDTIQMKAIVSCNCIDPVVPSLFQISGYADCHTLQRMFKGNMLCRHGCLGLGSCAAVCPTDAITIQKGLISISNACTGCGKCISECPKQLIRLVSINSINSFLCAAHNAIGDFSFCPTAKNGYLIKK